jgi:hypothetical protein
MRLFINIQSIGFLLLVANCSVTTRNNPAEKSSSPETGAKVTTNALPAPAAPERTLLYPFNQSRLDERLALQKKMPCDPATLPFGGGIGSLNDPFRICSETQLRNIRTQSSQNFRLYRDISLGGRVWETVPSFSGTIEGDSYKLSDFKILVHTDTEATGFIGTLQKNGSIKNLIISNVEVQESDTKDPASINLCIGTIVGNNFGAIDNCRIERTRFRVDGWMVGAIVGSNENSVTRSVVENIEVNANEEWSRVTCAGGAVGSNKGLIKQLLVLGPVRIKVIDDGGGLAGINKGTIEEGFVTGNVKIAGHAVVQPISIHAGRGDSGGLVGWNEERAVIRQSYASAQVTGRWGLGGIAGVNLGEVYETYSDSDLNTLVAMSQQHGTGILVGYNSKEREKDIPIEGRIKNSVGTGRIVDTDGYRIPQNAKNLVGAESKARALGKTIGVIEGTLSTDRSASAPLSIWVKKNNLGVEILGPTPILPAFGFPAVINPEGKRIDRKHVDDLISDFEKVGFRILIEKHKDGFVGNFDRKNWDETFKRSPFLRWTLVETKALRLVGATYLFLDPEGDEKIKIAEENRIPYYLSKTVQEYLSHGEIKSGLWEPDSFNEHAEKAEQIEKKLLERDLSFVFKFVGKDEGDVRYHCHMEIGKNSPHDFKNWDEDGRKIIESYLALFETMKAKDELKYLVYGDLFEAKAKMLKSFCD